MPIAHTFTNGTSLPAEAVNTHCVHVIPPASTGGFYASQTLPLASTDKFELVEPSSPPLVTRAGLVVDFRANFKVKTAGIIDPTTANLLFANIPAEYRPAPRATSARVAASAANSAKVAINTDGTCTVGAYGPAASAVGTVIAVAMTWVTQP